MAFNPDSVLVTDLDTAFDAAPTDGPEGPVLWATVKIEYVLSGLIPLVTIRVPVPYDPDEPEERRRGKALRCARQLIDHACQAAGNLPSEPNKPKAQKVLEDNPPSPLEGVAQELGLAEPTTRPKQRSRALNDN
jgi:hypothetical protein